jgi:vacuolar-type H+-ATPase subunit E/Vma4
MPQMSHRKSSALSSARGDRTRVKPTSLTMFFESVSETLESVRLSGERRA